MVSVARRGKAAASAPFFSSRTAANFCAVSLSAPPQVIRFHPGLFAHLGVVRRTGNRRPGAGCERFLETLAALPVGCEGSGSTENSRLLPTVFNVPQRERQSVHYSVLQSCPCRVDLYSVLTSEIRRATNVGEICHFTTLLNSGDRATMLPGTRHAPVKGVDVL